ncbi:MAG: hypothetical protein E7046_12530 [Lentisphaerae bacterium]|nr:hypothetical protein [Lentisphaerota bacterium]
MNCQMNAVRAFGALALAQIVLPCVVVGAVVFDFQNTDGFAFINYCNRLSMETVKHGGENALVFKNETAGKIDTYWSLTTPRFRVHDGKIFAVKVRTKSDVQLRFTKPMPAILWYAADGKELLAQDALGQDSPVETPMPIRTSPTAYRDSAISDMVPEGAAFARVRICSDYPNMECGQSVAVSRIEYVEKEEGVPWVYDDLLPPKVERLTPSPNADFATPVSFRISDPSGVSKVAISLDGTDITERVVFKGDVATYAPPAPWAENSIHEFVFSVEDGRGNDALESRFVCFTRGKAAHEKVSVRDDGVVLRDGRPFFPIAIWGVKESPLHGNSISRTIMELKSAGFNMLSTYHGYFSQQGREMISVCDREGIKVFFEPGPRGGKGRDAAIRRAIMEGRSHPSVLGWCIGDDTAAHRIPDELARDRELIDAVDPAAIAGHADACGFSGPLARFARWTGMFVGEMYPMRNEKPQPEELAKVQKGIGIAYSDLQVGGAPTPCVVPLIQSFRGWGYWKRYPTKEELRAMTFLALASRGRGIAYYTYEPSVISKRKGAEGAASTSERFAALARITRELTALSPQLVTRDAAVQPEVTIVEGPQKASYGFCSVKALLKECGLLIAVNISTESVKAVLSLPNGRKREVSLGRNGVFVGKFDNQKGKQT